MCSGVSSNEIKRITCSEAKTTMPYRPVGARTAYVVGTHVDLPVHPSISSSLDYMYREGRSKYIGCIYPTPCLLKCRLTGGGQSIDARCVNGGPDHEPGGDGLPTSVVSSAADTRSIVVISAQRHLTAKQPTTHSSENGALCIPPPSPCVCPEWHSGIQR